MCPVPFSSRTEVGFQACALDGIERHTDLLCIDHKNDVVTVETLEAPGELGPAVDRLSRVHDRLVTTESLEVLAGSERALDPWR